MTDVPPPTRAREPVPALDAKLVHAITLAIQKARDEPDASSTWPDWQNRVHALLASDPMQRLRAAWTAEVAQVERQACVDRVAAFIGRQRADTDPAYLRGLDAAVLIVEHEDLQGRALPSQPPTPPSHDYQACEFVVRERDEARAERDDLLAQIEVAATAILRAARARTRREDA